MAGVFWYNGAWTTEEPKILGPMDHAFWLGSSVFDGARGIRGYAPDLDLHCARVIRSAKAMLMAPKISAAEIEALCKEGIRRMGPEAELYVRPMFFIRRGLGASQPDPDSTDFILSIYDAPLPGFGGFSAMLAPFRRSAQDMAPTDAKASCLYPNGARAATWARQHGADNAVLLDPSGNVAELASANIWFAKDGVAVTPVENFTFLAGITRKRIIGLLQSAGVPVEVRAVKPEELDTADEVFSTGNFGKVQPCIRYNGRDLPTGPIATKARELYFHWMEQGQRLF
ncbi:branched-chain amino acid aminotransferase [Rhodovarius crocodyli]|uniref:Probable branched-chain-amino-acid aminotransferase n=1 Tax=Rhodovarius crocodyli TaxID=1979269 RepID=A0A437MIX4_9PROT|nr:branched-chain amino acid aminotransferase [Rhodovarius crocodyli]RVT97614.1 branched-chain amino acid aminotransferase [Rhodovarius crocodyli]